MRNNKKERKRTWFNGVCYIDKYIVTVVVGPRCRLIDNQVGIQRFTSNHFAWKINSTVGKESKNNVYRFFIFC